MAQAEDYVADLFNWLSNTVLNFHMASVNQAHATQQATQQRQHEIRENEKQRMFEAAELTRRIAADAETARLDRESRERIEDAARFTEMVANIAEYDEAGALVLLAKGPEGILSKDAEVQKILSEFQKRKETQQSYEADLDQLRTVGWDGVVTDIYDRVDAELTQNPNLYTQAGAGPEGPILKPNFDESDPDAFWAWRKKVHDEGEIIVRRMLEQAAATYGKDENAIALGMRAWKPYIESKALPPPPAAQGEDKEPFGDRLMNTAERWDAWLSRQANNFARAIGINREGGPSVTDPLSINPDRQGIPPFIDKIGKGIEGAAEGINRTIERVLPQAQQQQPQNRAAVIDDAVSQMRPQTQEQRWGRAQEATDQMRDSLIPPVEETNPAAFEEYKPPTRQASIDGALRPFVSAPSGGAIPSTQDATRTSGSLEFDAGSAGQGQPLVRNVPAPQPGGVSRLLNTAGVTRGTTAGAPATTPAAQPTPYAGPERIQPPAPQAQPFDRTGTPSVRTTPSPMEASPSTRIRKPASVRRVPPPTAVTPGIEPISSIKKGPTSIPTPITAPVVGQTAQRTATRPVEELQPADDPIRAVEPARRIKPKPKPAPLPKPQLSIVRGSGRTAGERVDQERLAANRPVQAPTQTPRPAPRDIQVPGTTTLAPRDVQTPAPATRFNPRDLPTFTPPVGSAGGQRAPEPKPPAPVGGGFQDERTGVEALLHNVNTQTRTRGMSGTPFMPMSPPGTPPLPDILDFTRGVREEVTAAQEKPEEIDIPERPSVRYVEGIGWVSGDEAIQPAGEQEGVNLQPTPEVIMGSRDSTGWERPAAQLIAEKEGFVAEPYFDPVGYPTIGYGQLLEHKAYDFKNMSESEKKEVLSRWQPVTKEQALANLEQTLPKYAEAVDRAFNNVPLNANEKSALVSFTYNLGTGIWDRESGKHLRDLIEAGKREGNMEKARQDFVSFNKARDHTGQLKELRGLTNRRNEEWSLFTKEAPAATQLPRTLS